MNNKVKEKGLGLIESLIIVLVVVIIVALSLIFFDPVRKFKSARDAERWSDTSLILNAIKDYQEDNDESFLEKMDNFYNNEWYMIVGGPMTIGCDDVNAFSDVEIYNDNYCIDISELIDDGYLGSVPVSPAGRVQWDSGINNNDEGTGYALMVDEAGIFYVQACESENTSEILIYR